MYLTARYTHKVWCVGIKQSRGDRGHEVKENCFKQSPQVEYLEGVWPVGLGGDGNGIKW